MLKSITFRQVCELINDDRVTEFCSENNIKEDIIYKIFLEKQDDFKDKKSIHCIKINNKNHDDTYYYTDIDNFLFSILKSKNRSQTDLAVISSVLKSTDYTGEFLNTIQQKPLVENVRFYKLFRELFDDNVEENQNIIIAALAEKYLIDEDLNPALEDFIENVFFDDFYLENCFNKTKDFFNEHFYLNEFDDSEDLNITLHQSFTKANEFEAIVIENSDKYELSQLISEDINRIQNELVLDTPFENLSVPSAGEKNDELNHKIRRKI